MNDFNVHQLLLHELAKNIKCLIVKSVIKDLRNLRGSAYLLSGDDTYLDNVWEEFCVDRQEGTNFTDVYTETVEVHIHSYLEKLNHHDKCILYLDMVESDELVVALEERADPHVLISTQIQYDEEAITQMLRFYIDEAAANFTNQNIERSINGNEELEDDEEIDDKEDSDDELEIQVINPSVAPLDQSQIHWRRKINHIDKLHGRPMTYPELELNAPTFSYHTPEEMDYLGRKHKYENSFRYKFRQSVNGAGSVLIIIVRYLLFTIASALVTSLAFYWFISLRPWENWADFYVWGPVIVAGAVGSFFVSMLSPSYRYAKIMTVIFALWNLVYWLHRFWTDTNVADHPVYFGVATLMICFLGLATTLPVFAKRD